jgi:hypothetical protein
MDLSEFLDQAAGRAAGENGELNRLRHALEAQLREIAARSRRASSHQAARPDTCTTELIVIAPALDLSVSIALGNLARNAVNPMSILNVLAIGGGLAAATAAGLPAWGAYALTVTRALARPVPYEAACVLHKAWQITPPGRVVTVQSLVNVGAELTSEYGIVKVAEADIETHFLGLERAGAVGTSVTGFVLKEEVWKFG